MAPARDAPGSATPAVAAPPLAIEPKPVAMGPRVGRPGTRGALSSGTVSRLCGACLKGWALKFASSAAMPSDLRPQAAARDGAAARGWVSPLQELLGPLGHKLRQAMQAGIGLFIESIAREVPLAADGQNHIAHLVPVAARPRGDAPFAETSDVL